MAASGQGLGVGGVEAHLAAAHPAQLRQGGAMPPHSARDGRRDRPGPAWLTFEGLIPLVWIAIYTCFYASALLGWNAHWNWALMGGYLVLLVLVQPHSLPAVLLLILYLLWSPIGTLVTWQMQRLNR